MRNITITKDMFTSIRKDLADGMTYKDAGEKYHMNPKTISRVAVCPTWLAWTQRKAAKRRNEAARARGKKAESCPDKTGDSGLFAGTMGARAMEEAAVDEVIQNPDAPVIVDELHEHRPRRLESLKLLGLPRQICERIHALSKYPAAVEIIGKAVVLCPESIASLVNTLYFPLFGYEEIDWTTGRPD